MAQQHNDPRLAELMLYVSRKCANDPKFGATKLNKILFYSDFIAHAKLGRSITGAAYQKLQNGPGPRRLVETSRRLQESGALEVKAIPLRGNRVQLRPIALREARLERFGEDEISLVNGVMEMLAGSGADAVSELSHLELGWRAAAMRETIPYGTIFLSDKPLSDDEVSRIQEFAKQHGYAR